MSKTAIKIFALPEEKAQVQQGQIYKNGDDYGISSYTSDRWNDFIPICIYITTSETPKIEDWFIDTRDSYNELFECLGVTNNFIFSNHKEQINHPIEYCRKVIAADDKDLLIKIPCPDGIEGCEVYHAKLLPQISPEFKQAWVREANKGTPILEALMEFTDLGKDACKFDDNHLDSKIENLEHNCLIFGGKCSCLKKIPKLNPQGYVTILPVKEKMHTQTEVENLILQFASDCENDEDLICYDGEIDGVKQYNAAKKWLKQNL